MIFQKKVSKPRIKLKGVIKTALIFLFFLNLLPLNSSASITAEVTDISNRKYYPAVKEALDNAQSSIYMAMFVITLQEDRESKVSSLLESLADASERGVEVKVILDKSLDFISGEIEYKSEEAYRYLRERGVNVAYDHVYGYTHSKTLVIDEEIVVVGSANWSQTALTRSNECALLVESPELAKRFIERISNIKLFDPGLPRPFDREQALHLSKGFLDDRRIAGVMVTRQDERAFDLYLLLLYYAKEETSFNFDFDRFAEYLQISDMSATAYRRQIIKTLRKLEDRYKLIEVEFRHGRDARVSLLDIEGRGEKYEYPSDNYFLLPSEYFKYGWDRTLSLRAKFCYLVNLYKYRKLNSRFWSLSREKLNDKFGPHFATIGQGMNELRRYNIIDTVYSEVYGLYEERGPARYELLGLYCPREHGKELSRLSNKYGEESFQEARKLAGVIFRQNDIEAIEKIIKLGNEYGSDKIKRAYELLSEKRIDNPKRTFRYAVGIIRAQWD